ncbi:hypothetical protein [Methanocella sp. MCL-LM]|uniref:hypothetical protein n=1 Tax=Methanocella sp. MCL-LM TaxID=3412035 RepID=UPI003C793A04
MDFAAVVHRHGEDTTQLAMIRLVSRIRQILEFRVDSAVNGVLTISMDELREDALKVARELEEFPFDEAEKCAVIEKAWEIIGP